jgi:hypothetical protein
MVCFRNIRVTTLHKGDDDDDDDDDDECDDNDRDDDICEDDPLYHLSIHLNQFSHPEDEGTFNHYTLQKSKIRPHLLQHPEEYKNSDYGHVGVHTLP